jgi:Protein of unknown function (DUF2808)
MKKFLIYTTTLALSAVILMPVNSANANDDNARFPHVDGNSQFPYTRLHPVRHTLRVHIPKNSQAVSQIVIQVPETLTISSKSRIDVEDSKGQKINTDVSIKNKTISLTFQDSLPPNTEIEIDINGVRGPKGGNGPIYRLSTKFTGSDVEIPIGIARFHIND